MRRLVLLVALAGCRQVLGIGDPTTTTTDAPAAGGDAPHTDAAITDGPTDGMSPTDGDLRPDAPLPTGLVAEWRFAEPSGTAAADDAPVNAAMPSTLTAGSQAVYTWGSGALHLTNGQFVSSSTAIATAVHGTGTFTVELWLTLDPNSPSGDLAGVSDALGLAFGMSYASGTVTGHVDAFSAGVGLPATLSQVTLTCDGAMMNIYLNGQTQAGSSVSNFGVMTNGKPHLGAPAGGGDTSPAAAYARLRIFDRALTKAEIQTSYAAGPGSP